MPRLACHHWIGPLLLVLAASRHASAQPHEGTHQPPSAPAPQVDDVLSPPELKQRALARYPEAALADRLEGTVGLTLTIDETGKVATMEVTSSAGHGFDEAASEAARAYLFEPARRNGIPVAARVQLNYEFHLPAPAAEPVAPPPMAPAPASATAPPRPSTPASPTGAADDPSGTYGATALVPRPISAASSATVRDRDFALRPIGSVQDILRITPGLLLVQHSGGGKANQYFMRGFDADHGTDLALSIDSMPINMVSHAHGQGYADTNFIIPEVVERVELSKGPYFAKQGDFATAGAINMVTRDDFAQSSAAIGFTDSPGYGQPGYRALVIASPKVEGVKATFAAEIGRTNGPFEHPDGWDKFKLWNKVTIAISPRASLTVGEMSYGSQWHGSGQVPARAVSEGLISRYGSLDPSEGGDTSRNQVFVQYALQPTDDSELKALAYLGSYTFNLFSDFTYFLRDPVHGDEIEQVDRRVFYGAKVGYRVTRKLAGVRFDTSFGAEVRSDDIHGELWNTQARVRLSAVRESDVHETLGGVYVNEEITPLRFVRLVLGGRLDQLSFSVAQVLASTDPAAPGSGVSGAHLFSPKASLIVTPLERDDAQLDLYANYGQGFHSNDVRGAFATPSVTPLTRAIGAELGSRARLFGRWDLAVAFWHLDLDNETVWNGDDGTTAVSGASTRRGVELETRYELTSWLAADLDLTFTHSASATDHGNGNGLALAPKQTWAGGLSARHVLGPGTARGGLRFFGISERPASDDGVLKAPGFTQLDLHLGYRHRRLDLALDIENLLDQAFRSAQFATVSRLAGEPAIGAVLPSGFTCGKNARLAPGASGHFYGCEDVAYTPAFPLTARLTATLYLD